MIREQAAVVGRDPVDAVIAGGMDAAWLRKIEQGRHWPCLQTLERIGDAIDLHATDILVMADELDGETE